MLNFIYIILSIYTLYVIKIIHQFLITFMLLLRLMRTISFLMKTIRILLPFSTS